jgi:hypothetical protein
MLGLANNCEVKREELAGPLLVFEHILDAHRRMMPFGPWAHAIVHAGLEQLFEGCCYCLPPA